MGNPFDLKQSESRIVFDKSIYFSTTNANLQTAFSSASPGSGTFQVGHDVGGQSYCELTIDGNIVINDRQMTDITTYGVSGNWDISWNRSCLIRIREAATGDNALLIGSYQDRRTDGKRVPTDELYFSTSSATLVTAKELHGAGEIQYEIFNEVLAATYMQVTIDGNIVVADRLILSGTLGGISGVWKYGFNRSFKLEVREAGASNAIVKGFYWNR